MIRAPKIVKKAKESPSFSSANRDVNPFLSIGAGFIGSDIGARATRNIAGKITNIAKILDSPITESLSGDTMGIAKKFKGKHKLTTKIFTGWEAHPSARSSPVYIDPIASKLMRIRKGVHIMHDSPGLILHELGHAADFKKFPKVKMVSRSIGPVAGILVAGKLLGKEKSRKYAPAAAAAGFAPMLWQEGKASTLAYKFMKKNLPKTVAKKEGLKLLKAFGTYASLPIGAALGVYGVSKLLNTNRKENDKMVGAPKIVKEAAEKLFRYGWVA
jgi:hypothetical protein